MRNQKILIVDDEPEICLWLSSLLQEEGYITFSASNDIEAIDCFSEQRIDLVILDVWLKGSSQSGLNLLEVFSQKDSSVPILMISGHSSIDQAVQAMRDGAFDFIQKPFKLDYLLLQVERALKIRALSHENTWLRQHKIQPTPKEFSRSSLTRKKLYQEIQKIAKAESRVFLEGDTGVGKRLVAETIHNLSSRGKTQPFIAVDGFSLQSPEQQERFFGYQIESFKETRERHPISENKNVIKGSEPLYSIPDEEPKGIQTTLDPYKASSIIEQVEKGTLYLYNVNVIPPAVQKELLFLLQGQSSGSYQKNSPFQARLITSCAALEAGFSPLELRKDLLLRLQVLHLIIPALSYCLDEIPALVEDLIRDISQDHNRQQILFDEGALIHLQCMNWSEGNIKQLMNFLERLVILYAPLPHEAPKTLTREDLLELEQSADLKDSALNLSHLSALPLREARTLFEREYLRINLNKNASNVSRTAEKIGMQRSALHRKLRLLSLIGSTEEEAVDSSSAVLEKNSQLLSNPKDKRL